MKRTVDNSEKFVLFPLGKRRFALRATAVTELAIPDVLQPFPHTTPLLTGVLLRRGHIIPVLDVAQVLIGPNAPQRKFYLIASRKFARNEELTAVPVSGECELLSAEMGAPAGRLPKYVIGLLNLKDEIVEVIELEKLAAVEAA
jgi:two-component system, chemotaxis family, chemotaxis protein CheV